MIGTLVRQDLKLLSRDYTFALAVLIALFAVGYALSSNQRWAADQRSEFQQALLNQTEQAKSTRQRLLDIESGVMEIGESPATGLPNSVSMEFLKAPGPLAELAIGDSDLRPVSASIKALGRTDDLFRSYQVDNPQLLALGRFDVAFVVIYLMPLLILALSFSVLSAEAESGALQMLLSQPVSAAKVAWTRIALRTALIVAVVLGGTLVAWWMFSTPVDSEGASSASESKAIRFAAFFLATTLYGAFWGSLAGAIAGGNRSTESNALLMLMAWVLFTLIIPAAASTLIQTIDPMPSRLEYTTTARDAENRANANASQLLKGYLLDHPEIEATEKSAVAPFIKTFVLVQKQVEDAVAPISETFNRQRQRQQRMASLMVYFSPASLTQKILAELAGTSSDRHFTYEREATQLRQQWLLRLEAPLIGGRRLTVQELDDLPRPNFAARPIGQVLSALVAPALSLLVFAFALTLIGQRRLRRFKPNDPQD